MGKKRDEDQDVVAKLKQLYRDVVGYSISNHIGNREIEDVAFAETGIEVDQVGEFIDAINEEFDTDLQPDDLTEAPTFGDFINRIEASL